MNRNTAVAAAAPRIGRQVADSIAKTIGNMTQQLRVRIMDETLRHVGSCGEYEVARITAKSIGVSERVVNAVVIASYLEERSRRAALETGIRGAIEMSAEAGREVWAEIGAVNIQARSI